MHGRRARGQDDEHSALISNSAVAKPMPVEAPVTSATFWAPAGVMRRSIRGFGRPYQQPFQAHITRDLDRETDQAIAHRIVSGKIKIEATISRPEKR